MKTLDDATLRTWLDLDLDGALGPAEKSRLDACLEERDDLRSERAELAELHALLAASRIEVRPGFAARVAAALPAASWERQRRLAARPLAGWYLPAALLVVLTGIAMLLLGRAEVLETGAAGTALAIFDLFQAAFLAGAGLIGASWRGAGLALEELFAISDLNVWVLALGILLLNALFALLLRRRWSRPQTIARHSDDRG